MIFWDNQDLRQDFLKKNWISLTFCPFWSQFWSTKCNLGVLYSRDQSRSRSRTSFVSRLTFLKCPDYPSRRDQLFFSRSRFLKSRLFNPDLAASRYLSRSSRLMGTFETFEIYRDFSRFLDIIKTFSRLFRDFRWCRDKIEISQSRSRYLDHRD